MSPVKVDMRFGPQMSGAKLIDPTDTVVMEDEGARMTMSANPQLGDALQHVVTGVIAAVRCSRSVPAAFCHALQYAITLRVGASLGSGARTMTVFSRSRRSSFRAWLLRYGRSVASKVQILS